MCGIAGYCRLEDPGPPDEALLRSMLGTLRHRGPDESGIYADRQVGLGSTRLNIIDPATGTQPIPNEDGTVWTVFNGEVFNHRELRHDLEGLGHRFATNSDTEVLVHLYEEHGPGFVEHVNGQFALAVWDRRTPGDEKLILARDRVGIRPLFYTQVKGTLVFASGIGALFARPDVLRRFDPRSLVQVLTLWAPIGGCTPFDGIRQLPPAHVMVVAGGRIRVQRYWDHDFTPDDPPLPAGEYADRLRLLLGDATRLRLGADVTVGAYLSGGIDSSTIARLAADRIGGRLETFSIGFEDPAFDEAPHQAAMVAALGTDHASVQCRGPDIAAVLPEVVRHAEFPILRSAPAPMFLLSRLVHEHGIKVVLTGEGADEVLGGYGVFKEDRIRRFWAREPGSRARPLLLSKLYPYVADLADHSSYLSAFFGRGLTETGSPVYSHAIRWANTAHLRRMLSADVRSAVGDYDPVEEVAASLSGHPRFGEWSPLARAQYIEMTLFMSGYLLSSQGDRMLMAHSVEGRFPFLDHRVIELAARMPDQVKLRGLNEKYVLKQAMKDLLPPPVVSRSKQPFRAPVGFPGSPAGRDLVQWLLHDVAGRAGVFSPRAMDVLASKVRGGGPFTERDGMALVAAVSTLLLHESHVDHPPAPAAGGELPWMRRVVVDGAGDRGRPIPP